MYILISITTQHWYWVGPSHAINNAVNCCPVLPGGCILLYPANARLDNEAVIPSKMIYIMEKYPVPKLLYGHLCKAN